MRWIPSVVAILALGLVSGCSRSLRPDLTRDGAAEQAVGGPSGPPRVFVLQLQFAGDVVELDASLQALVFRHRLFYLSPDPVTGVAQDTVPAYSVLENIRWYASKTIVATEDRNAGTEGAPDTIFPYPPGQPPIAHRGQVFAPGIHELRVAVPDRLGGGEVHVRFKAGFHPDTWWAGPDASRWPIDDQGQRSVEVVDWSRFTTVPPWPPDGRAYFGPDSFRHIPSLRRPVGNDFATRTFYEIHGNRIYARREGDSVHLDSWLVFINGGYDKDSPYRPLVSPDDPALPPGFAADPLSYPLLHDLGLVGSPIGFRLQWMVKLPDGIQAIGPQSSMYPNFDPFSVFRFPDVAGYYRPYLEGRAYVVVRAEDSDGLRDGSILINEIVGLVDRVDAGGGTPQERLLRRKILTFFVGSSPGASTARVSSRARGS